MAILEAIITMLQSLRDSTEVVGVPIYPSAMKDLIKSIEHEVNTKRRTQGMQKELTVEFK